MELKDYQTKYRELISDAEAIREEHKEADSWPAEDVERFDQIMEKADEFKATIDRLLKAKEHEEWGSQIATKIVHPGNDNGEEPKDRPSTHVKAFDRFLRTGIRTPPEVWAEAQAAANPAFKAAMQEAAGEGLELVPEEWQAELVQAISEAGVILPLARRITMGTNKLNVPTLTASAAAVLTSEETTYDEKEPTTGEVEFDPYKFTRLSKVSDELLADAMFDIWGQILNSDFANAFALAIDSYGTTGTGSAQPQGVITGATVGVTAASATAITADELIDLYHALGYQYRDRPAIRFMAHDSTIKAIRKLKDADNQYLWQPGLQAGQPDRLLGRILVTNNNMAEIAASAKTVLFGDFFYFWIAMREDITVKRLEELYSETGQVGFRAFQRWDSNVMLATAFQVLQQASA